MKNISFLALCAITLLAGCDSMSSRVQERFTAVPPHSRVFAADLKAVYQAAQVALKRVGLLLGHTSISHWSVSGYAPIRSGDATSDTRQTTIEIRLAGAGVDQTQVDVLVWEQTEGKFPGGVSERAYPDHSLYEAYFAALQEVLVENGALKAADKP